MKNLSIQSINFLNATKSSPVKEVRSQSWKQNYTKLFCELYEIISKIGEELKDLTMGKWSLNYEGEESHNLVFQFKMNSTISSGPSQIRFNIVPFGTSFIEAIPLFSQRTDSIPGSKTIKDFKSSPAYKRYFAANEASTSGIKVILPPKQITSRHFGEYLSHLVQMMGPYLKEFQGMNNLNWKAA